MQNANALCSIRHSVTHEALSVQLMRYPPIRKPLKIRWLCKNSTCTGQGKTPLLPLL